MMTMNTKPEGFGMTALAPEFKEGQPLTWKRREDGELETNVRWRVRHHSPTGFEVGYSGSGPADFALNAMAALFPMSREEGDPVECFDGNVSSMAWRHHQPFKFAFLSGADKQEGRIEWKEIAAWLEEQGSQKAA
jgi:hypothetical protein